LNSDTNRLNNAVAPSVAATLITLVVAAALKISAFGTGICIAVPGNVIVVVSALVGCAGASIVLAGSFSGDSSHAGGGWIAIGGNAAGVMACVAAGFSGGCSWLAGGMPTSLTGA